MSLKNKKKTDVGSVISEVAEASEILETVNNDSININSNTNELLNNDQLHSDLLTYEEINFYLHFINKDKTLAGFRKGKIPTIILHIQNPDVVNKMVEIYLIQKTDELKDKNLKPSIDKVKEEENGLRIFYKFESLNL